MIRVAFVIIACGLISGCLPMALMGAMTNASQTWKIYELDKKVEQLEDDRAE